MVRMYDFGADISNISANERRAIAWPVAVWTCYIPESEVQDLNILEHLILQLVNSEFEKPDQILCEQLGFNKDLVEAALESCKDKDYFDRRYKGLRLSKDGKSILGATDNPYISDLEVSQKSKKIYMIQDLITKNVVPVFDINKLPQFYYEDENAIELHFDNFTGKKPRSASVKTALRRWAIICHNCRNGIITGSNIIETSEIPETTEGVEDFIPFEDEVNWESIQEDGTVIEDDVRTLDDKEKEEKEQKEENDIKNLTILDDFPEQYWARGFIAIDKNSPDNAIIISPFGARLDHWFRSVFNQLRACNSDIEEKLQYFLMEKQEELKYSVAFGNDLEIDLFNEYPYVCNDVSFKAVKATISRLTVSRNRFKNGEDDSANFSNALRNAYEASIRLVVKNNPSLLENQCIEFDEYQNELIMLENSYSFIDKNIVREYSGRHLYNNMRDATGEKGYTTAFIALILIDAWNNKNGKSMEFLKIHPKFPVRMKEITSNLRGNKIGIGNAASHGGDENADLKLLRTEVEDYYEEFKAYFRALYNMFMEESING